MENSGSESDNELILPINANDEQDSSEDGDNEVVRGRVLDWVESNFEPSQVANLRERNNTASKPPFLRRQSSGPCNIPPNCRSSLDFFKLLYSDEIIDKFINSTNSHGIAEVGDTFMNITPLEYHRFIAIIFYMGINQLPERRMYWRSSIFQNNFVRNLMTERRFEQIIRFWHYEDTSKVTQAQRAANNRRDGFWTVQEKLTKLNNNFQRYFRLGQDLDIDEGSIPFKGRHRCRCYNPMKPNKFHFKLYCLNDSKTSYLWSFFMYQGKDEQRPPNVSATSYPIIRLTDHKDLHGINHILFMDNWYTNVNVLIHLLEEKGIHTCGTLRVNRQDIPKEKLFKKTGPTKQRRGTAKVYIATIENGILVLTCWQDNKPVHILSTFSDIMSFCTRNTQDRGTYQRIEVPQPKIFQTYNSNMGGTDSFDQRLSYYRNAFKARKWYMRHFTYFMSVASINAYILFREMFKRNNKVTYKEYLIMLIIDLLGEDLPEDSDEEILQISRKRSAKVQAETVPLNVADHTPQYQSSRGVCRWCQVRTVRSICTGCKTFLCIGSETLRNCWKEKHECRK